MTFNRVMHLTGNSDIAISMEQGLARTSGFPTPPMPDTIHAALRLADQRGTMALPEHSALVRGTR